MAKTPDDIRRKAPAGQMESEERAENVTLDGARLSTLLSDASSILHRHVEAINAINVFPVPDGDTGTNMHLTLRSGIEELERGSVERVDTVTRSLAHGALMGARGNSGVILSQVVRGLAQGLDGRSHADGPALAEALSAASDAAYGALSEPKEGTILTVAREAAEAVAHDPPPGVGTVLSRAAAAASDAVARTPEQLPVLKEAGVVDAGGLGLSVILEGMRRSLLGEPLDVNLAPEGTLEAGWRSDAASMHRAEHGESGYCTEFMVTDHGLDATAVRDRLRKLGTSLLVVGEGTLLRVHLHTTQPDDALAYGRTLGEISQVKVENMEAQIDRFAAGEPPAAVTEAIDIVAVAAGEGIGVAFRSVGVTYLVQGGQTMNPSAGEILEAITACRAEQVVVLPNNSNIVSAARQAAEASPKQVAVVPSRSVPQGVAAVLALNPEVPFDANAAAMERALASVRSAEVTRAVRATVIDGRRIEMGQAIGIIDGTLRIVAADVEAAVHNCVEEMLSPEDSLLTLYIGRDVRDEDAAALASDLRTRHAKLDIEDVRGGQPNYPYILSLE